MRLLRNAKNKWIFLLVLLGLASLNVGYAANTVIPQDIINKLVKDRLPKQRTPAVSNVLDTHLHETEQLIKDIGALNARSDAKTLPVQTRAANKLTLIRAKQREVQGVRAEIQSRFKTIRDKLAAKGLTGQLKKWDALSAQVEQRFTRLDTALRHLVRPASARKKSESLADDIQAAKQTIADLYSSREQGQSIIGNKTTPTWRQLPSGPAKTEPVSKSIPAYLAAAYENAQHMLAANGDALILAAAPVTPPEAASCNYAAADLAEDGQEIQLTPDIQVLAEKLGYSAANIYEYVANEIAYEPYYGSLKGAEATLQSKAGSATDQASLMIALLRASNIPARYVRGVVDILDPTPMGADGRAQRWLGTKDYQGSANRVAQGGNPTAITIVNGSSQAIGIRISHVWVEACVPYAHYRGVAGTQAGHRWVPLDPSFEDKDYHGGIDAGVSFDYASYLSTRTNTLPQEAYEEQIEPVIKTLPPYYSNNTLSDVAYQGVLKPRQVDILPASLPYDVNAFSNWSNSGTPETATLPDTHRYHFNITVKNSVGSALASTVTLSYPQSVLDRVTLSFKGATAGDQSALDTWLQDGDINSAAPCTINVVPVIKLEGIDQAVGTGTVGLCAIDNQLDLSVTLSEARNGPTVNSVSYNNISAASYMALQGYAFQVSDRLLADRTDKLINAVNSIANPNTNLEETEGEFLHITGLQYMRSIADANKRIGEIDGGTGDSGNHIGLTASKMKVEYLFDIPFAVYRQGYLVDAPGGLSRDVDLATGDSNWDTFLLGGYADSAYESLIWQNNALMDAISTVRGLQYANETGVEVLELTSANWAAESPKFTSNPDPAYDYSTATINSIKTNYIDQGYTVTAPRSLLQYSAWKGTVFVAALNDTGSGTMSAGYIINGGYAGGYTVGDPYLDAYNYNTLPQSDGMNQNSTYSGDPVNMVTGNMYHVERDIAIPARGGLPVVFERSYNSNNPQDGPLGFGWTDSFNHYLTFEDDDLDGVVEPSDSDGITSAVQWVDGTGAKKHFDVTATAGGIATGTILTNQAGIYATLSREIDGTYHLMQKNGLTYVFDALAGTPGQTARLLSLSSRNGGVLTLSYSGSKLNAVTDELSRSLTFTYTGNHITQIQDWTGRTFQYQYDANGNLSAYYNPLALSGSQPPLTYAYYTALDGALLDHKMQQYTLPRGNGMSFEYYTNGKVFRHYDTLGETTSFAYNDFRREVTQTNERGYERHFFFNQYGNVEKIIEENGAVRRFTYDAANPMNRITSEDPMGLITQYQYDAQGNITGVTKPSGSTMEYSYFNTYNQPGKIKDFNGNYTLRKYDTAGNLTDVIKLKQGVGSSIDPTSYVPNPIDILAWTIHGYDAYANRISTKQVRDFTTQEGPTVTFAFDSNNLYPVSVTRCGDLNGDGIISNDPCNTESLNYDVFGRLADGIRSDWERESYSYDSLGRIGTGTDIHGNTREFYYDENGNPIANELRVISNGVSTLEDQYAAVYDLSDRLQMEVNAAGYVTQYEYDSRGNIIKITDPDNYYLQFEYDGNDRMVKAYDKEHNSVQRKYDAAGRLLEVVDPNGNSIKWEYYGASHDGRLYRRIDALGRETVFDYDANGNVTAVTDNLGRTTYTQYDALNRPERIVRPAFTQLDLGSIYPVTRYQYDNLGNLIQVDAGYTTAPADPLVDVVGPQASYVNDDFGRRLQATDPNGSAWTYNYDVHGNVVNITDAKGQIIERNYGYNGVLLTRTAKTSPSDLSPHTTQYTRNVLGQVTNVQAQEASYSYEYDTAHRLHKLTNERGGKSLTYDYSPGNLLNKVSDSDGNQTDYLYDPVGRLSGIWAPGGDYVSFAHDAGGRITEKWFPNGVNTQLSWNADNTLAQIKNRVNYSDANIITQDDYTYDAVGNRETLTERVGASTTNYRYVYDELNRLSEVQDDTTSTLIEGYSYDQFNNRATRTDGTNTWYYLYDAAQQLKEIHQGSKTGTLTKAYAYDANGSLTKKCEGSGVAATTGDCSGSVVTSLQYDVLGRMAQANKTGLPVESYQYDHAGRRIQKTVGSTVANYLYQGTEIRAEYDNTWGSPLAVYTHGAAMDDPLIRESVGGTNYYHTDGMGSAVALSDSLGATVATQRFDAWGNVQAASGTIPQYGYTGREPDATGLVYYRARYYDPDIGRFTQRDPLGFIDGVNRYAYALNSPVNFADPWGLYSEPTGFWDQVAGYWNEYNIGTRLLGGLQLVGGGLEAFAGATLGVATSWTGIGAVGGGLVFLHGTDVAAAGLETLISGQTHSTLTAQGLQAAGLSPQQAAIADAGLSIMGTGLAGLATQGAGASSIASTTIEADAGAANLSSQVDEIHNALDPIAQSRRTTAVLSTDSGTIAGGGARDLTPAQRAVAEQLGATPARLPGAHAEVTAITEAQQSGMAPRALEVSRDICPSCQAFIESTGGQLTGPRSAIWP